MNLILRLLQALETRQEPLFLPKPPTLRSVALRPFLDPVALPEVELLPEGRVLRVAIKQARTDNRRRDK